MRSAVDFLLGPGWTSRLIAWAGVGAGGYSHAAPLLQDGRYLDARDSKMGGEWHMGLKEGTLEMVPAGVHIRDPYWEKSIKRTRATLELTQTEYDDWEANLRARIGTPYSRRSIWGFVSGEDVQVRGHWDCSAHAIDAYQHIKKIVYPLWIPAHQVAPNYLLGIMQQAGAVLTDVTYLYSDLFLS